MADVLILIDQQKAMEQEGNDFPPLTAPHQGEPVVAKKVQSAFIGTDLSEVEATLRVASNLGFTVRLPADACWSCDKRDLLGRPWPAEAVHQLTLALLDGEYATVTTVDAILAG